jgi:NodT family efflux transporter outer membrane factor (OMF) lipoprotein
MNSLVRSLYRSTTLLALAALGLGLDGCLVGPTYTQPPAPTLQGYVDNDGSASVPETRAVAAQRIALGQAIPTEWWSLFHSSRLDDALKMAIAANYNLAAAKANLAAAQEQVLVVRGSLFPSADLLGSGRRSNTLGPAANTYSVGPSASYLVDAFGLTRRRIEQQGALAENTFHQLQAAYLAVTGNLVTEAISIAVTRFQIATVGDLIKNDERNLDLIQREFSAGKVARTDVLTASAQLEADRTQLPNLYQQLSVARHATAVLVGKAPAEWTAPDFDIEEFTLPNDLPLSLPSELVRRRPDILEAEAQLHADSAAIGVATAQLYPSITLTASLVQQSLELARVLDSAARQWSVGGSVDAPLSRGGALNAQKRAAMDSYNAQFAVYRQTVLTAFGQVADSLLALEHDAQLVGTSQRARDVASESLDLQRKSYAAGKTSALQLISAENTYSDARQAYVRAVGQRLTDTAGLFIAAGGGWPSAESMPATPVPPEGPSH